MSLIAKSFERLAYVRLESLAGGRPTAGNKTYEIAAAVLFAGLKPVNNGKTVAIFGLLAPAVASCEAPIRMMQGVLYAMLPMSASGLLDCGRKPALPLML
jgi:hypothetical protein